MAILVVAEAAGMTAEHDAALVKVAYPEGSWPIGARIRMAGPTADGWRIVGLWDSQEDFERFRDERLVPAFTSAGRPVPPVEIWQIDTVRTVWEL